MKQKAGLAPESARWALERKLAISCKPQRTTFQEGKVPETISRKKACGKNESQPFLTKINLTSGIIEHSFSRSPEILKGMTKYQTQMTVTVFQNLCDICMMCLSFMPNIFKRNSTSTLGCTQTTCYLYKTSVYLLAVAGLQ